MKEMEGESSANKHKDQSYKIIETTYFSYYDYDTVMVGYIYIPLYLS